MGRYGHFRHRRLLFLTGKTRIRRLRLRRHRRVFVPLRVHSRFVVLRRPLVPLRSTGTALDFPRSPGPCHQIEKEQGTNRGSTVFRERGHMETRRRLQPENRGRDQDYLPWGNRVRPPYEADADDSRPFRDPVRRPRGRSVRPFQLNFRTMVLERGRHSRKERGRTAAESIVLFMLLGAVLALATYMTKDVYESVTVSREIAKFLEHPQER